MRLRRSLLFVSGAEPSALEAAGHSSADSLILDLEDTVAPVHKPLARRQVADFLAQPACEWLERAVRVNGTSTPWFPDDIEVIVTAGADALVIPKALVMTAEAQQGLRLGFAGKLLIDVFLFEGRMVELPVVESERSVLERARRAGVC